MVDLWEFEMAHLFYKIAHLNEGMLSTAAV